MTEEQYGVAQQTYEMQLAQTKTSAAAPVPPSVVPPTPPTPPAITQKPLNAGYVALRNIVLAITVVAVVWFVFVYGGSIFGIGAGDLGGSSVDTVSVQTSGCWTGSIFQDSTSRSVEGCGNQTFPVSGSIVSVLFQKQSDDSSRLTVQLLNAGRVVEQESTTAAYGIASVVK